MTTIRSDNETHRGLNQEQEHTVVCVPPTPSPEVPRKKDGSSEYVEISVYKHIVISKGIPHAVSQLYNSIYHIWQSI